MRRIGVGAALTLAFALLAWARPVDHDESQYVAAAVLVAHGLLPYRDFAYLQTPLQPFLFAPIAFAAGIWTFPALRLTNALLGVAAVVSVHAAARRFGAPERTAIAAAVLFATCDVLLFGIGTARNDALPAALFAAALVLIPSGGYRAAAIAIGALLAAAAAAKVSYAVPAFGYGLWTLGDPRRRRTPETLIGALPVAAFVVWTLTSAPEGFLFGVFAFPAHAPGEYYAAAPWRLGSLAKAIDTLKFLALGAGLPALVLVARDAWRRRRIGVLEVLILAGLLAALLPAPTWRQYLLPMLPPLFVRLSLIERMPRDGRIALAAFACAGIAPTLAAIGGGDRLTLVHAIRDGRAIGGAMDANGLAGPVATLSPELLPAAGQLPDPAFATGPFYFRSGALLDRAAEHRLRLVSHVRPRIDAPTILIGGEGPWTGGDAALDRALAREGRAPVGVPGTRYVLLVRR